MVTSDAFAARRGIAIELARRAGAMVLRAENEAHAIDVKSSMTDIVTATDRAAEEGIVNGLLRAFADDGVYAEESSERLSESGYTWIIDPLDGTANFVRNLRSSAISIALAYKDVVRLGIIFDPYSDQLFVGALGQGATCNGVRLDVSENNTDLDRCFVGVSGSNRPKARQLRSELLAKLVHEADSVRDPGSTALSLCWTAAGRFDAHIGIDVAWWDFAAGVVIAREAGCVATGFDGEVDPVPEGFVVAPKGVMVSLAKVLAGVGISVD